MVVDSPAHSKIARRPHSLNRYIDRCFRWSTLVFALIVPLLILALLLILGRDALPSIFKFRGAFLVTRVWDAVHSQFGILFAIYGTVVSSMLALLLAVPISLGTAIFLSELAPSWLREPVSFLIELLAAIPSIVYGLWGIFVLVPLLQPVENWLEHALPVLPTCFRAYPYGNGMLAAGIILAVMILPYITAVSREVIRAVPHTQREALARPGRHAMGNDLPARCCAMRAPASWARSF